MIPSIQSILFHQLNNLFSLDKSSQSALVISRFMPEAIRDATICLSHWKDFGSITEINPLNSRQYSTFLVILSRKLYVSSRRVESEIISYLNKTLNSCEIYGHVEIPQVFLLGHTIGIVLGKAIYGNYLCIQHHVTVGAWRDKLPLIMDNVMLMNGSLVAGESVIGNNSVVAPHVRVVNQVVPDNVIAFQGSGKDILLKPNTNPFAPSLMSNRYSHHSPES